MRSTLKLLCVLAHPDVESLGLGGTLAKCASEGIETYLVTAMRGERGWLGGERTYPGVQRFTVVDNSDTSPIGLTAR